MANCRPRDPIQLANEVFLESIGEKPKTEPIASTDPAAVALGRKGGTARAAALAPKKRAQIASKRGQGPLRQAD
ncbi:MAG: hypothetical protein ABSB35_21610 [Bryobacteraceae bacterium]|jgi:hypothetical protein